MTRYDAGHERGRSGTRLNAHSGPANFKFKPAVQCKILATIAGVIFLFHFLRVPVKLLLRPPVNQRLSADRLAVRAFDKTL